MGNLFDGIIKQDSVSPVENVVVKYLNWQNQRNVPQELEQMKNDPNTVLGLINPAGGLSNAKSILKGSGEKAKSASWISNSGKEYILDKGQIHEGFAEKLGKLFKKPFTDYDLYERGWIRKAYPGSYSVVELKNKTINFIRKNIINDKNLRKNKIYIDIVDTFDDMNHISLVADTNKFIKFGKKALKRIEKDTTDGTFLPWELE